MKTNRNASAAGQTGVTIAAVLAIATIVGIGSAIGEPLGHSQLEELSGAPPPSFVPPEWPPVAIGNRTLHCSS
jgi:hypothetical protein